MEGGKEFSQVTALFTAGKLLGNLAGITLFSVLLSLVLNGLDFNKATFITVFTGAAALRLMVRGMVKRRWL